MFQTERLWLRAFQEDDMDNIIALVNDVRVQPLIDIGYLAPHGPSSTWMKRFRETLVDGRTINFTIEKLETREFVGHLSLATTVAKNRNAEFGIMILPTWWSIGYGTEVLKWMIEYVFVDLGLHRLSLMVFGSNERAIDLYKRLGFTYEGANRKANWNHGKWEDIVHMAMLDEEWAEKREIERDGWVELGRLAE